MIKNLKLYLAHVLISQLFSIAESNVAENFTSYEDSAENFTSYEDSAKNFTFKPCVAFDFRGERFDPGDCKYDFFHENYWCATKVHPKDISYIISWQECPGKYYWYGQ